MPACHQTNAPACPTDLEFLGHRRMFVAANARYGRPGLVWVLAIGTGFRRACACKHLISINRTFRITSDRPRPERDLSCVREVHIYMAYAYANTAGMRVFIHVHVCMQAKGHELAPRFSTRANRCTNAPMHRKEHVVLIVA